MLKTLYRKLSLVLLLVLLGLGALSVWAVLAVSRGYAREVQQRLNVDLARHLVAEKHLMIGGQVQRQTLEEIFHLLMVVNPSIEVYLLDPEGEVLAYSAPPGHVKRQRVSLAPVTDLLAGRAELPVLGDDPRDLGRRKIFSAAPIGEGEVPEGYLYVILAGEQYESGWERLAGSQILRLGLWAIVVTVALAVLAGLFLFRLLTRRLERLTAEMDAFDRSGFAQPPTVLAGDSGGDEIDRLAATFQRMAAHIAEQIRELKAMDAHRRELFAHVSHDLRTPLAHVLGYLETVLLKEADLPPEERREYLEIALRQTERLGKLVAKLFELAKLDAAAVELEKERFSLAELVQDVAQKFRLVAEGEGIELEARLPRDQLPVAADLGLVERVLQNLLDNALHFTPQGGRVTLSLTAENGEVAVAVTDTGCGIPSEEIPRVFERFYHTPRGKERGEEGALDGTGLGLAIAKRIVELHGGTIQCTSVAGEGTTFAFTLPLAHP